jgi:hypothetical protein
MEKRGIRQILQGHEHRDVGRSECAEEQVRGRHRKGMDDEDV